MLTDLRFAGRVLRKHPGFTAVAVLSLALGIGANTAIFTLIDTVLLRAPAVDQPGSLVVLQWTVPDGLPAGAVWISDSWQQRGGTSGTAFSYPAFARIRAAHAFSDVVATAALGNHLNVVVDGQADLAHGQAVSANYFSMLGVRPRPGRGFTTADDTRAAAPVCVISDAYWRRRFGGDAGVVGRAVRIAGLPFTIAGVAPATFAGLEPGYQVDVWVPLSMVPVLMPSWAPGDALLTAADHWWLTIVGRLDPDATAGSALAEVDVLVRQTLDVVAPEPATGRAGGSFLPTMTVERLGAGLNPLRRDYSGSLFVLMGLVALVLLIACANTANLLLVRASARRREMGIRLSLGASRGRLLRQLLTESLLLSTVGAALGLLLAQWGSAVLVTLISSPDNPIVLDLNPDARVLLFTAAAAIAAGLLFGMAPALHAARADARPLLTSAGAPAGLPLARVTVIAQVALSLVLLVGAGLFGRTLLNLDRIDPGFARDHVLFFGVNPTKAGYDEARARRFYDRLSERLTALPGAASSSALLHLPLSGGARESDVWVPGYVPRADERPLTHVLPVGGGFFQTMEIAIRSGRDFTARDARDAPKVVVVNESFVREYFRGTNPIGRRIGWTPSDADLEIVGVASDAQFYTLRGDTPPTVYQPYAQADGIDWMFFGIRTAQEPRALAAAARDAVRAVDPGVPVFGLRTGTEQVDDRLRHERLFAGVSAAFGGAALLLACIGVYGLLSYAAARRTREIGIRMALGARPSGILRSILLDALRLVGIGLAAGVLLSWFAARSSATLIADRLYGITATDTATLLLATATLAVVALSAAARPAWRAARVDPVEALRAE